MLSNLTVRDQRAFNLLLQWIEASLAEYEQLLTHIRYGDSLESADHLHAEGTWFNRLLQAWNDAHARCDENRSLTGVVCPGDSSHVGCPLDGTAFQERLRGLTTGAAERAFTHSLASYSGLSGQSMVGHITQTLKDCCEPLLTAWYRGNDSYPETRLIRYRASAVRPSWVSHYDSDSMSVLLHYDPASFCVCRYLAWPLFVLHECISHWIKQSERPAIAEGWLLFVVERALIEYLEEDVRPLAKSRQTAIKEWSRWTRDGAHEVCPMARRVTPGIVATDGQSSEKGKGYAAAYRTWNAVYYLNKAPEFQLGMFNACTDFVCERSRDGDPDLIRLLTLLSSKTAQKIAEVLKKVPGPVKRWKTDLLINELTD
jgi:hypothetical protein